MSAVDSVTIGLLLPAALGCVAVGIRGVCLLIQSRPKTAEQKERVVYARLVERYTLEGNPDPQKAASDHVLSLYHMERFRRHACEAYVATGRPLSEIREEWWKENSARIQETYAASHGKADTLRYAKVLKGALESETEAEIFIYGPAESKWKREQARVNAEIAASLKIETKRDPIADHVVNAMYEARATL